MRRSWVDGRDGRLRRRIELVGWCGRHRDHLSHRACSGVRWRGACAGGCGYNRENRDPSQPCATEVPHGSQGHLPSGTRPKAWNLPDDPEVPNRSSYRRFLSSWLPRAAIPFPDPIGRGGRLPLLAVPKPPSVWRNLPCLFHDPLYVEVQSPKRLGLPYYALSKAFVLTELLVRFGSIFEILLRKAACL